MDKEINTGKPAYTQVPTEWIEGLMEHIEAVERSGSFESGGSESFTVVTRREKELLLIGYCSSAKTIIKYNKHV